MPIYKLCNFFRSSRGRNDRQHSGARDPGQKRRGGGGPNKSWQQDRQCTLLVLQRAVDLLQLLTLKVAKMPAFETDRFVDASLGRSSSAHQLRCQLERSTTLEEEDDGSELRSGSESGKGRRKGRRRRGSKRIFFAVPLMIAITVCTTCCAFLMEPKRALTDVQSPVIDFLVPVICTTVSFMVIIQFWKKSHTFVSVIHQVYDNLVELPAVYCLPGPESGSSTSSNNSSIISSISSSSCSHIGTVVTSSTNASSSSNCNGSQTLMALRTFTMAPLKHRAWARTMQKHHQFAALMSLFTLLTSIHLVVGASQALFDASDGPLTQRLLITAGFSLQALLTVLYPLINYAYVCLCVVFTVQSEHLNQFVRSLKVRCGASRLPLQEELLLVRVWFSRVARCLLAFDRFGHIIFFLLYSAQIGSMLLKSVQVHEIFARGAFTFTDYVHFIELGLLCFGTILHMQIVYNLNKSIAKPSHYVVELGAHGGLHEPPAFTEYLAHVAGRFASRQYQLTLLRVMSIGKEFFMITSFFIITAVASYGSFGQVVSSVNHQLHLLI